MCTCGRADNTRGAASVGDQAGEGGELAEVGAAGRGCGVAVGGRRWWRWGRKRGHGCETHDVASVSQERAQPEYVCGGGLTAGTANSDYGRDLGLNVGIAGVIDQAKLADEAVHAWTCVLANVAALLLATTDAISARSPHLIPGSKAISGDP